MVVVVVVVIDCVRRRKQADGERMKRPMLQGFQMHELNYESLNDELESSLYGSNDNPVAGCTPDRA